MGDGGFETPAGPGAPVVRRGWHPLQVVREMLRRTVWPLQARELRFAPAFEVKETGDAFVFKVDLPGVRVEDLDVALLGDQLTVTGRRQEESRTREETYLAYERPYGSFARAFRLADAIDPSHIEAELKSGELTIVVPKSHD